MFHWNENLFFGRMSTGAVRVLKFNSTPESFPEADGPLHKDAVLDVEIPTEQWASIVASVSAGGESSASYHAALGLHAGGFHASGL